MGSAVKPGAQWRVKAEHPERPGSGPLCVYDKAGNVIATAGQTCESVAPELLASMIRNGYVEPVN